MVTLPKLPKVSFPHRKRGYQPYKSENNVEPMSVDQFIGVDEYSEPVDSIETEVVSRKQADDKNKSFRGFKVVESVDQYDVKTSATDTSYEKFQLQTISSGVSSSSSGRNNNNREGIAPGLYGHPASKSVSVSVAASGSSEDVEVEAFPKPPPPTVIQHQLPTSPTVSSEMGSVVVQKLPKGNVDSNENDKENASMNAVTREKRYPTPTRASVRNFASSLISRSSNIRSKCTPTDKPPLGLEGSFRKEESNNKSRSSFHEEAAMALAASRASKSGKASRSNSIKSNNPTTKNTSSSQLNSRADSPFHQEAQMAMAAAAANQINANNSNIEVDTFNSGTGTSLENDDLEIENMNTKSFEDQFAKAEKESTLFKNLVDRDNQMAENKDGDDDDEDVFIGVVSSDSTEEHGSRGSKDSTKKDGKGDQAKYVGAAAIGGVATAATVAAVNDSNNSNELKEAQMNANTAPRDVKPKKEKNGKTRRRLFGAAAVGGAAVATAATLDDSNNGSEEVEEAEYKKKDGSKIPEGANVPLSSVLCGAIPFLEPTAPPPSVHGDTDEATKSKNASYAGVVDEEVHWEGVSSSESTGPYIPALSASTSSTSTALVPAVNTQQAQQQQQQKQEVPAPPAKPKIDHVQLLMPFLVNYGYPPLPNEVYYCANTQQYYSYGQTAPQQSYYQHTNPQMNMYGQPQYTPPPMNMYGQPQMNMPQHYRY